MTTLPVHRRPLEGGPARTASQAGAASWMAVIFLLTLIIPIFIDVGSIRLLPHRISLLLFFWPCLFLLLSGRAGKITWIDMLFGAASLWAVMALVVNHGFGVAIQPLGIFVVEFYGAYLLARTTIRSAADFRRITRCLLGMLIFMLPFAVHESVTGQTLLLNIIPKNVGIVDFPYRLGLRRAQVLFTHPIHYGIFAALTFGLFWFVFQNKSRYFTFPLILFSTFFSLSSGALICLVMQLGLVTWNFVLRAVKARWYILGGGVLSIYTMANLFTNSGFFVLVTRYAAFDSHSAYARILIWRYGTENVAANPLFGLGLADWARPSWMIGSIDNFFLHLTMRYGMPFIILFAVGLVVLLIRLIRAQLDHNQDQRIRLGLVIVLIGGVIVGGGTVDYWGGMLSFVLFLMGASVWLFTGGATAGGPDEPALELERRPRGMQYTRFPPKERTATGGFVVPGARPGRYTSRPIGHVRARL